MADPPTPSDPTTTVAAPTESQLDAWQALDRYAAASGATLQGVGTISSAVGDIFTGLSDSLKKAGLSLNSLSDSSSVAARQAGLLTTAFLGAREAFVNIANVDSSRLVTTGDQLRDLYEIIKTGPGTALAAKAIETVLGAMTSLGASSDTTRKAQQELKSGVMNTAMAFFTSADNVKRLQNSMIQMTVSGSGLDSLLKAVGSDFQNLDKVNQQYVSTLNKVTTALGGTKKAQELAASYMATINQIPGGLSLLTKNTEIAGKQTDLLTATLNIASASGRDEKEVLADITSVVRSYKSALDDSNEVAGAAATLTSRMGEIAGHLGANIKDVHSALMESTDAFKMYVMDGADAAKMTQGMAQAMENYTSSLEAVGVPAANAIEMFKNYTNVMKNMNTGQLAFISTMSGGAGGLRGALKMQEDIAKGNIDEIRQRVEATIKRISGPLITREEGMRSEAGAAQYMRQVQILQQGPLSSMARSPAEAEALIRAMKEGRRLPATEAARAEDPMKGMQDAMKAGQKIQKDSYSVLVDINASLNELVMQAGLANRKTEREILGTRNLGAYGGGIGGGGGGITPSPTGVVGPTTTDLSKISDIAISLPKTVKDAWDSFKEVLGTGNKESIQKANDKMLAAIKEQQAVWGSLSDSQKSAMTTVQQAFNAAKTETATTTPPTTATRPGTTGPAVSPTGTRPTTAAPRINFTPIENYARPGQRIPAPLPPTTNAPATTAGTAARPTGGLGTGAPGQAVPVTLAPGSAITVNFTGACPHCGGNIRHGTNGVVSPQSDHPH